MPDEDLIRWLLDHGVGEDAMMKPWLLQGGRVTFLEGGAFDFDLEGDPAIIFRAEDRGTTIDWIAWDPLTGQIGTWYGLAFTLGDRDQIDSPASLFDGDRLRVHASPLEWLRDGREGIVILRPELAWAHLRQVDEVVVADPAFGHQLGKMLRAPRRRTKILVEVRT